MTLRQYIAIAAGVLLATAAGAGTELPDDEGRDVVEYACSQCHDLIRVTDAQKTARQWEYLVNQMINQGAPIEEYEVEIVVRYLVKHFGEE